MTISKQGNNRPFTGQMNPRDRGLRACGALPVLFYLGPITEQVSVLVEKIKVLREKSRRKASQETCPLTFGKGAFQVKVRCVQRTKGERR